MMSFNSFKKVCSKLIETCENCGYFYEIGVASDKEAFLKIYAHEDRIMFGTVLFKDLPEGVRCFVSTDILKGVPYLYIFPDDFPF